MKVQGDRDMKENWTYRDVRLCGRRATQGLDVSRHRFKRELLRMRFQGRVDLRDGSEILWEQHLFFTSPDL